MAGTRRRCPQLPWGTAELAAGPPPSPGWLGRQGLGPCHAEALTAALCRVCLGTVSGCRRLVACCGRLGVAVRVGRQAGEQTCRPGAPAAPAGAAGIIAFMCVQARVGQSNLTPQACQSTRRPGIRRMCAARLAEGCPSRGAAHCRPRACRCGSAPIGDRVCFSLPNRPPAFTRGHAEPQRHLALWRTALQTLHISPVGGLHYIRIVQTSTKPQLKRVGSVGETWVGERRLTSRGALPPLAAATVEEERGCTGKGMVWSMH